MILRDASAARWLIDHDLTPEGSPQLAVDHLARDGLGLTRIWHSAAAGRLSAAERSVLLVLQLDGDLELSTPADISSVGAGEAFALSPGQEVRIGAGDPTARIELELPAQGVFAGLSSAPLPALAWGPSEEWSRSALISLTNSVLNLEAGVPVLDFDRFATALLACAAAFLRSASDSVVEDSWSVVLVRRAQGLIERRAADPGCSVRVLARELGVSPAHLARAFQTEGLDTPLRVIRAYRLALALGLLERGGLERNGRPDLAELARLSGFGSTDSLRRALREAGPRAGSIGGGPS